jgi:5-bromo-4-chloroindolyl phosphate hydrolysis protein
MPITLQDISERNEYYKINKFIADMKNSEYEELLNKNAFFYSDAHGFIRHTLSDEPIATHKEQLDLLIKHLEKYRDKLDDAHPILNKG